MAPGCTPNRLLVIVAAIAVSAGARAQCTDPAPTLVLPAACPGEATTGSTTFCFSPELGCLGTGVVAGVILPAPPFVVTALRVSGTLGTRAVVASDYPLLLLPGDSLVADVTATVTAGGASSSLGWVVSTDADPNGRTCTVGLVATPTVCAGPDPVSPCAGEVCIAGACVPSPLSGACDDGDPCTVGDTCAGGVCVPGPPLDCSTPCTAGAACVGGACVGGTPVSCADGNPCTVDSCDPVAGCLHVPSDALCQSADPCMVATCDAAAGCVLAPATGPPCDDGDPCTTGDRCAAGTCRGVPITCADTTDCTDDRCVAGACVHVPVDPRCGSDECAVGSCRPGDPRADARGCVSVPVGDGDPCTDDGFACTDDVCTAGACLHVPIDARCNGAECQVVSCAPERADSDANGCATGAALPAGGGRAGTGASGGAGTDPTPSPPDAGGGGPSAGPDGGSDGGKAGKKHEKPGDGDGKDGGGQDAVAGAQSCAEDGDPCTDDVCTDSQCVHTPVPNAATCAPVNGAFRKALGLAALTRGLMTSMESAHAAAAGAAPGMAALGRVEGDLGDAVLALSGKLGAELVVQPSAIAETPAEARARIAFTHVLRTPQQIRSFLTVVAQARARAVLGRATSRTLSQRGRLLLRGTKTLKGDLRRLRQVSQTFAR